MDLTAPETTITTKPTDPSNDATPSFDFTSESGATFECRIDSDAFADCESGDTFGPLSDGEHTFEVQATDTAGNTGAADSHTWTIDTSTPDTTPPNTTIETGPSGTTNNDDPGFTFSSDEPGSTFECKLDDGDWEACNSGSKSYTDVADGEHTFQVYACDAVGNCDASPASRTWTIDTTAPDTTINTNPPNPSSSSSASFTFSSETGATFQCKLDTGAWEACNSGAKSYSGLSDGEHTFQVYA